ncbi:MAG: DUF2203 domain-containing protein [Gemmatimonadales bacterium]
MNRTGGSSRVPLPYTVERANRALPLVRRIVDDLVACFADWQDAVVRFEYATSKARADAPDPEADRLQHEAQEMAEEVAALVAELEELGVECRSLETGLVDFPGELEGRPVYFCWMKGEPAVGHWHDVGAGFSGRQPLRDPSFASQ